ncbi:MAG: hypothetical protein KJ971_08570 [Firmicutes bacterium]|nr:hypothetical protein [Bacillota bacterium]
MAEWASITAYVEKREAETAARQAEVEAHIDRLYEAQQPDNRFIEAIIEDTERREAIWAGDPEEEHEDNYIAASNYDTALNRELAISSPSRPISGGEGMSDYPFDPVTGAFTLKPGGQGGEQLGGAVLAPGQDMGVVDTMIAAISGDKGGLLGTGLMSPLTEAQKARQALQVATGNIQPLAIPQVGGWTSLIGPALTGIAALIAARTKMPWDTPEGEGFIAPWTNQQIIPGTDLTGQQSIVDVGGYGLQPGLGGGNGGGGFAPGGVAYSYTNASKDGRYPATAQYIRMVDGKTYVKSMKTGVIKRVRRPHMVAVHSRMRLGDVAKAQRKLDSLYKQIAKRTPLKRGK